MHSLVLAFSQHLVNILTSPSLTVPKVSPVTTEFSAISAGRLVAISYQVSSRCSYLVLNHSLGMVYFWVSLFMAWISMLLLASRTFNSLMTQVMLPILASMWCFCSASFSTSLSPRSRLSPAALLKRMELKHVLEVRHAAHLVLVVVGAPVVVHPVRAIEHLAEHGGHVVDVLVLVSLVDHGVGEPVGGPVGGEGELGSVLMAALGNGLLHVDHDKLHGLLAPAALHGLQLLPLLDHLIIHATDGDGGQRENHKQLHAFYVSLQGSG